MKIKNWSYDRQRTGMDVCQQLPEETNDDETLKKQIRTGDES